LACTPFPQSVNGTRRFLFIKSIKSLVFDENIRILCEISGYYSGVTDDSDLLECDAESLGEKFPTLQRIIFMVCLNVKIKTVRSFEESGKIIRQSSVISQKT